MTIQADKDYYLKRNNKSNKTVELRYGSRSNLQKINRFKKSIELGFQSIEDYNKYWYNKICKSKNTLESSLEKQVEEFLKNNNFTYVKQYYISNKDISHTFDFAIFKDNKLEILVDSDGLYYHNYLSDINGKSVNNYSDDYRQLLVPSNVKFLIILENNIQKGFEELYNLYNMNYIEYILDIFNWCRETQFPYPEYSEKILLKSFTDLCISNTLNFSMKARYGEKIILNFHKSIYTAHKYGKLSPYEAWQDDDILLNSIKNRIIYKGCNLDRSKVLAGLTISGIAPKVSIFNPYLAKYLIYKYLNNYSTIFDPFSGYSGRLLGVCSLNKKYIGQDINKQAVDESNNIINFYNLTALVTNKNILEDTGSYECLFTCPPYNKKEIWNNETVFHSCDEWIDICLKTYQCNTYLFVVDETEKYKGYIVEELVNKSHFSTSIEYVIKI